MSFYSKKAVESAVGFLVVFFLGTCLIGGLKFFVFDANRQLADITASAAALKRTNLEERRINEVLDIVAHGWFSAETNYKGMGDMIPALRGAVSLQSYSGVIPDNGLQLCTDALTALTRERQEIASRTLSDDVYLAHQTAVLGLYDGWLEELKVLSGLLMKWEQLMRTQRQAQIDALRDFGLNNYSQGIAVITSAEQLKEYSDLRTREFQAQAIIIQSELLSQRKRIFLAAAGIVGVSVISLIVLLSLYFKHKNRIADRQNEPG